MSEEEDDLSSAVSSDSEVEEKQEREDLRYEDPHYLEDDRDLNKLGGIVTPITRQGWLTGNARLLVEPERIDIKRQRRMAPKGMYGSDYFVQAGEWLFAKKGVYDDDESAGVLPLRSCLSGVVIPKNIPDEEVPNYFFANYGYKGMATEKSFGVTRHWSYLQRGKGTTLNTGTREVLPGDLICVYPSVKSKAISVSGFPREAIKRKPWLDKIRRVVSTTTPLQHMEDLGIRPEKIISFVLSSVLEQYPDLDLSNIGTRPVPALTTEKNVAIEKKVKHLVAHMKPEFKRDATRIYMEDNLVLTSRTGATVRGVALSSALPGDAFFIDVHQANNAVLSTIEKIKMDLAKLSQTATE